MSQLLEFGAFIRLRCVAPHLPRPFRVPLGTRPAPRSTSRRRRHASAESAGCRFGRRHGGGDGDAAGSHRVHRRNSVARVGAHAGGDGGGDGCWAIAVRCASSRPKISGPPRPPKSAHSHEPSCSQQHVLQGREWCASTLSSPYNGAVCAPMGAPGQRGEQEEEPISLPLPCRLACTHCVRGGMGGRRTRSGVSSTR